MTPEVKKSLWSAVGVLLCVAALGAGAVIRDRVELGPTDHLDISNMVASNSDSQAVPETKFYEDIVELLKRKYVEPISDERKLADGAVRAMVGSLSDPNSLYMDKDQYRVYSAVRKGEFEGIGANMILDNGGGGKKVQTAGDPDEAMSGEIKLPKLVVASIVPGSAAEKAGLKPGDWAEFVNDHWIPNSDALESFVKLQKVVFDGKPSAAQSAEYVKLRQILRAQMDKSMLPIKARDLLMMGTKDSVKVTWARGNDRFETDIQRGIWKAEKVVVAAEGIRPSFAPDSVGDLQKAIEGKKEVVLDLRGVVSDDSEVLLQYLSLLAKSGTYGEFVTQKKESPMPLIVKDGNPNPPSLRLLVDRSTRGVPEILAAVLSEQGAKVQGDEMADQPFLVKWYQLPSGAGYTLVVGEYTPVTSKPKEVAARGTTVKL